MTAARLRWASAAFLFFSSVYLGYHIIYSLQIVLGQRKETFKLLVGRYIFFFFCIVVVKRPI